jgi:ring-1,2-phenylacetyl-CoA epoxidase subunit PaaB
MGTRGGDRVRREAGTRVGRVIQNFNGGALAAVFTIMANDTTTTTQGTSDSQWPLWEVFLQPPKGEAHEHAGSVHATTAEQALQNARDVYARRGEAVSIWVVPSASITASTPEDMGPFFDPGNDKPYRHPQFYKVPRGIRV